MAMFLEILDGELKGTRTPVRDGLVIGRREGLLTIRDSKLSSKHAQVEQHPDGSLWLVDLGSANGIKVGSKRLRELRLEDGAAFTLGRTPFSVITVEDFLGAETPTVVAAMPEVKTVWEDLTELCERAATLGPTLNPEIGCFVPTLKLKFVRGIQTGTQWNLGYGPREVGADSLDLQLDGLALPARCFALVPEEGAVRIKRLSEREVRVNGIPVNQALLRDGDMIEILQTQIKVNFDENP